MTDSEEELTADGIMAGEQGYTVHALLLSGLEVGNSS